MHAFLDNEDLLPTGYDVIANPPSGVLCALFREVFWKSDQDFLIVFHSKNFYMGCMLSKITRFWCKPDMTSLAVLRQGCCTQFFMKYSERATVTSWLCSIVHFVYLGCMVSEITRFNGKADMTSSWFLRQEALHANFLIADSERVTPILY